MENLGSTPSATLLIISGPVGVGKTSTGTEVSSLLNQEAIPHTFIDMDALTYTFPRDPSDRFATGLALKNLAAIWQNAQAQGAKNLIVPRVCETPQDALNIAKAVGIAGATLCRLTAQHDTLLARVRQRETGAALTWHENRAIELADQMADNTFEDFTLATDNRPITEIAHEIVQKIHWKH